jgi:LmbE family N-acetylglucosaminyl deacetylase
VRVDNVHSLARYDCLFISPHTDDATLSCVGRMLWERNRGQRVLVVVVFAEGPTRGAGESHALEGLGIDELRLELPSAPTRDPAYGSFAAVLEGGHPADAQRRTSLVETLDALVLQTQAKHIYLPLGVGGHVDHLIVHEAGSQAIPESAGREIFFYEDRPYAFLPGAIWIRLGQLGARLPPAAHLSLGSGLVQYLLRFQFSPYVRAHATGLADRLRSNRAALRHWMDARGWHPRRAQGPRLQPIDHPLEADALTVARDLLQRQSQRMALCTSTRRDRPRRPGAAPRLRRRDEAERYWLLLPSLERDLAVPEDVLEAVVSGPRPPSTART